MKQISLLFSLLTMSLLVQAQTSQLSLTNLPPALQVIKREAIVNSITALSLNMGVSTEKHIPKTVPIAVDLFLTSQPKDSSIPFIKKHRTAITKYFEDITFFGESSKWLYYTVNEKEVELPFCFATNNNMLTFIQTGIFYDNAVNTYNSNANQRASLVAKKILLPSLFNLKPLISVPDIKYFCLIVGFISKDFTNDSIANGDGESISIVIPKSLLTKYINAEITDEAVFSQAAFYSHNKATQGNIKKVLLK